MDKKIQRAYNLGRKSVAIEVRNKLLKRANYLLKNVKDPDSPMILVATELVIQSDEIGNLIKTAKAGYKK